MPKNISGVGRVYSTKEISEKLNVSKYTILRYYRSGKLQGRKFGRTIFFLDSVLKEFLQGDKPKVKKEASGSRNISKADIEKAVRKTAELNRA